MDWRFYSWTWNRIIVSMANRFNRLSWLFANFHHRIPKVLCAAPKWNAPKIACMYFQWTINLTQINLFITSLYFTCSNILHPDLGQRAKCLSLNWVTVDRFGFYQFFRDVRSACLRSGLQSIHFVFGWMSKCWTKNRNKNMKIFN